MEGSKGMVSGGNLEFPWEGKKVDNFSKMFGGKNIAEGDRF
ncbi:MAG TPA: hypothetical protein VEC37_14945 [Bacillota bacterium]|nr:hypothetical protein [Bacillota bacterium]